MCLCPEAILAQHLAFATMQERYMLLSSGHRYLYVGVLEETTCETVS